MPGYLVINQISEVSNCVNLLSELRSIANRCFGTDEQTVVVTLSKDRPGLYRAKQYDGILATKLELKSLIMAQIERWRQA